MGRQFLDTPHPSGVGKGRRSSREVGIRELSQAEQAVVSWSQAGTCVGKADDYSSQFQGVGDHVFSSDLALLPTVHMMEMADTAEVEVRRWKASSNAKKVRINCRILGWREGSADESICIGPGFCSQYPCGS